MTNREPTTEKLAKALEEARAPEWMIKKARAGRYDDYKSVDPTPIHTLVQDCVKANLPKIAYRAMRGDFDAQEWEGEEWANSPEGQEIRRHFGL